MNRIASIIIALIAAISLHAMPLAQQADSAYNAKDYAAAVRLYHQAINTDGVSPQIYYNLGNAYYRTGRLGRAVIYYERALALDPSMQDARANLDFVNTKILDKPEDDSSFLGNLHHSIVATMTPNAWAWTAFGMFVAIIACVALYIFTGSITLRKIGFFGSIGLFFVWIYSMVCAWTAASAINNHDRAVVIVPTANLTTSPGSVGKTDKVIPIHEGTRVEIIDSLALPAANGSRLWYDVKINNSTRAWVSATDVEKI